MQATTSPVDPFAPAKLGPLTLRNRIVKAATFEGRSQGGLVDDSLIEFHQRVAAGGAALSTVAYLAVSREGMGAPNEIWLREEAVPGLRRLTDAIHAEGAAAAAQLGHAGAVGGPMPGKRRPLGPSNGLSPVGGRIFGASEADIARVTGDFTAAARLLVRAGFDAIELHLGHGYLLSAFLSPRRNKRMDAYGGSVEKRARFPREVVRAVREAIGPGVALTAKLNMADGVPGGTWLDTSVETAHLLAADGALDALQLTGGSSLENPMYLFRGEVPRAEFAATLSPLLRLGFRLIGRRFLVEYPFEEAFFLPYARQFLAALDLPLILLGGIDRLDTIEQALAEGFAFVAMARALLREPDLPNRMREGRTKSGICIHCNKCMPTIYSGTRCVLVDDRTAGS
jgi:2,4-dienoyl-CoA reductase-like NADH-dependent reductase (Old Yellow Enzyme family)